MKDIIETERLILREWKETDAEALFNGLSNFETAKNLTVPFPYKLEYAKDFISRHLKNSLKSFTFAITLKETGEVIGGTSLDFYPEINKYKGGIWLNQKFTGFGYGTETWIARAKFAFEELNVEELENGFFEFNEISKKMQQKIGYKIVGKRENFSNALNKPVTEIITLLTKEDFYKYLNNK